MKVTKTSSVQTEIFQVEDGPIMHSDPNRIRHVRFRVQILSISTNDGKVRSAFVRGPNILSDGSEGKLYHDRTLLPSSFPYWLKDFLAEKDK